MNILEPAAMRAWETREIASGRADEAELMRAAVAGAAAFLRSWREAPRRLLVLAGKGNNGNDGLLLAATLRAEGWEVCVRLSTPPAARRETALGEVAREAAAAEVWSGGDGGFPAGPWTVVDALAGSGAAGELRGAVAEMVAAAQGLRGCPGSRFVSLDTPSGLGTEGVIFAADATVVLGAVPPLCLRDAHRRWVGRLVPVALPLRGAPEADRFITPAVAARGLPRLAVDGHKYQRGEVAIWAGSPGMAGAAALAAHAALRAGAGVVRLWTHPELAGSMALVPPEVMVHPLRADAPWPEALVQARVILAGPGVGRGEEAAAILRRLGEETRAALVLDADALVLAARDTSIFAVARERRVVATPHAGEWKRLLGHGPEEREAAARALVLRHPGVAWLLKGPNTLVGDPDSITWNATGNPGMASAGMGDVLGGVVAALLARGLEAGPAARLGACWHGLAADLACRAVPEALLTAGDVLSALPEAWAVLEECRR
jgi:NAD(P)H-hydrate epimerase